MFASMTPMLPGAAAEFLEHYAHDAPLRWTPGDVAAQEAFVRDRVSGADWVDWSTPAAALGLVQAGAAVAVSEAGPACGAVILAGPVAELLDPGWLFDRAAALLPPGGRLIAILPCLRDNSPESRVYVEWAAKTLWPCPTAEELLEILAERGWRVEPDAPGFVAVPRFKEAVLKDELRFKGYRAVFDRLAAEGYDPMEIGWGELRVSAAMP